MKQLVRHALAHIPTKLPQGMAEFETWSNDIIDLYKMPNNDSIKFALATAVMHLSATDAYKPKAYFGRILIKGAANQIVYAVMNDLKIKQQELAQKQAEATAQLERAVASDEQQETIS